MPGPDARPATPGAEAPSRERVVVPNPVRVVLFLQVDEASSSARAVSTRRLVFLYAYELGPDTSERCSIIMRGPGGRVVLTLAWDPTKIVLEGNREQVEVARGELSALAQQHNAQLASFEPEGASAPDVCADPARKVEWERVTPEVGDAQLRNRRPQDDVVLRKPKDPLAPGHTW